MAKVVSLRLAKDAALKLIRELARDSNDIVLLPHARKRCRQRGIIFRQILTCLRNGIITEGPFRNARGNWQVTMERLAAGEEIAVGVVIEEESKLLVITVF